MDIISSVKSDMGEDELIKSIYNTIHEYNDNDDDLSFYLSQLLGYDNLDVITYILERKQEILNLNNEEEYSIDIVYYLKEMTGLSIEEARYSLYRHNYDINETLDQYFSLRYTVPVYYDYDGNVVNVDQENERYNTFYVVIEDDNIEYVSNMYIVDYNRPPGPKSWKRELDLHGYKYQDAIDVFRTRFNYLIYERLDSAYNKQNMSINFTIITGRGAHSAAGPVIKKGVIAILKKNNIPFYILEPTKGGAICACVRASQHMI